MSYTVNIPNEATTKDIIDLIRTAWVLKCNGITLYRDGSRKRQVLTADDAAINVESPKRPPVLSGNTYKYAANIMGDRTNVYVTVNSRDGQPWEVFIMTPYIRDMETLQLVTSTTRLVSRLLRVGDDPLQIIKQLRKVEGQSLFSVPAVIATALEEEIGGGDYDCPECGGEMAYTGGCRVCPSCGYSTCG